MLRGRFAKKAQTTAEYAVLIALVIGAVIAMQVYVRRGLQGRIREAVNHTGLGGSVGNVTFNFSGNQYEPYYLQSNQLSSQGINETSNMEVGGAIDRGSGATSTQNRFGVTSW